LGVALLMGAGSAAAEEATAVATFHSVGLYWTPDSGGQADRYVQVRFREDGGEWRDGLAMRYNPIADTDEDRAEYRGSIVHLKPGTDYEVQLSLDDTSETSTVLVSTWSEQFPEGTVVPVDDSSAMLEITESGTETGYRVYDGQGATIDVAGAERYSITIDASYVIVRNLNLRGGTDHGIRIFGGTDIVIEDLDISAWGDLDWDGVYADSGDSGIYSGSDTLERLVVQRCRIHHPNHDTNSWEEEHCRGPDPGDCTYHPAGPQTIRLYNSAGNHVVRYNELYSELGQYFNDTIGAGTNGSYVGFPSHDSDIYGNYVADCWDDGIEAEGGNRNVRIWGNYVEDCFMAMANAATSIGPLYVWRNVSGKCRKDEVVDDAGNFMKMGYASSEDWMTGHMYLMHNTILNVDDAGCNGLGGSGRIIHHAVTRNNILHVRSDHSRSISTNATNTDNDYDYDLYNAEVPAGHEANGISGTPTYETGTFDRATMTGDFALQSSSPGYDDGVRLPNFNDDYRGEAPDMGAHEAGADPPTYGIPAASVPQPCEQEICDNDFDDDCDGSVDEDCPGAGGAGGEGGGSATGGSAMGGGATGGATPGATPTEDDSGCGCRTAGDSQSTVPLAALLVGLLAVSRRRRR
jgi:MYXO-CTERM domain-containing protein